MIVIYSLGLRANKNTGCTLGGTSMSTVEPPLFFFFFFFSRANKHRLYFKQYTHECSVIQYCEVLQSLS